jgi:UDP-2-acetamido-3-amino-2,3-dideoxy-glucuronate N-acetyltransferase
MLDMKQVPYIDSLAKVDQSVEIGECTKIWAFASVHAGVKLGKFVGVGEHTYIGIGAIVGDRTRIGQGVYITDHMTIGNDVFIAPHVVFANDKHPVANNPNYKRESPIVEDDVSIGTNATIMPGVRLGRGCIVGAGAVVTHSVPPYIIARGNPARFYDNRKMEYQCG